MKVLVPVKSMTVSAASVLVRIDIRVSSLWPTRIGSGRWRAAGSRG
jgi:hypothetical protein